MKRSSPQTSVRVLSDSLLHKLSSYSLAATACGVGILALTIPCNAEIVYTSTQIAMRLFSKTDIDIDKDGVPDLRFTNYETYGGLSWETSYPLNLSGFGKSKMVGLGRTYPEFVARFDAGVPVGPELFKGDSIGEGNIYRHVHNFASYTDSTEGFWRGRVNDKYVALKFLINGETHYGWMRLTTRGRLNGAILTGYAYETVPNKPILTGQTSSDIGQLPSPTLGQLARGATQGSAWRRDPAT